MDLNWLARRPFFLLIVFFIVLWFLETVVPRPTYGFIYSDLGLSAVKQNHRTKAIQYYQKASHYDPQNPVPYEQLGVIAKENGQTEEMIGYYAKAASLRSRNEEIYSALGRYYFEHNDFAKASEAFLKVTEIDRKNAQIFFQLGLAYEKQNLFPKAIASFQEAIRNNYPHREEAIYHLGISYFKTDDLINAKEQMTFLKNCGVISLIKDFEAAIGWDDPQMRYRLGRQYYDRGNIPGTMEQVQYLAGRGDQLLAGKLQELIDRQPH